MYEEAKNQKICTDGLNCSKNVKIKISWIWRQVRLAPNFDHPAKMVNSVNVQILANRRVLIEDISKQQGISVDTA